MYTYCDCRNSLGKLILSQANLGRGKMQLTPSDEKGLCIYCGYITIKSKKPLLQTHRAIDHEIIRHDATVSSYIRG